MSFILRTLALFGLLSLASAYYTGDGTAYSGDYEKDATGKNACGYESLPDVWEKYYAALPTGCGDHGWSANKCGQCIRARGIEGGASGDWVVVKMIDQCASCSCGDVDFSTRALKEGTGFSWDRKKVEWEWTSCDGSEATASSVDGSSSGGQGAKCKRSSDCDSGFACSKRKHRCYKKRGGRRLSA